MFLMLIVHHFYIIISWEKGMPMSNVVKGYFIRSSRVTPSIYFNTNKGLLDIRGRSSPENPLSFYQHLFRSLDQFCASDRTAFVANMAFEYFNTSSSKCIYMIFKKLDAMSQSGKKVVGNWYYEDGDEDMKQAGEDLSSLFNFEFNFRAVHEIKILGAERTSTKQFIAA